MQVKQIASNDGRYCNYLIGPFSRGETEWAHREARNIVNADKEEHFAFAALAPLATKLLPVVKAVGPSLLAKGLNLAKSFIGGKVSGVTELAQNIASKVTGKTAAAEEEAGEEEEEEEEDNSTLSPSCNPLRDEMDEMIADEFKSTVDLDECVHVDISPVMHEGKLFLFLKIPAMEYDRQEYFLGGLMSAGLKGLGKLFGRKKRKKKRKLRRMQEEQEQQMAQRPMMQQQMMQQQAQNTAAMGVELPLEAQQSQTPYQEQAGAEASVPQEEEVEEGGDTLSEEDWEDAR